MRQWAPLCHFISYWGQRGVDALHAFELKLKAPLKPHTYRILAGLSDPRFGEDVLIEMTSRKTTIGKFTSMVNRCVRVMWCWWQVHHPESPLHAGRSVSCEVFDCVPSMLPVS